MRRLFDLSQYAPARLAALSILGSLLCPFGFGILYLSRRCGVDYSLIATGIVSLILGFVLFSKADTRLTDDTRNQRWTSDELRSLRTVMQHPVWNYLIGALLLGQLAPFVFIAHHPSVGQWLFIPSLAIIRVRGALRPPTSRPSATSLLSNDLRPIHSDHWGER
jgi:hypothetical protein